MVGDAAGFWRRFASALIDGVLLGIAGNVVERIAGVGFSGGTTVAWILSLAYFTYLHGSTGQTLGDAALGIRVVDVRDAPGRPIGYGRAFVRFIVSIPSGFVPALGYLWMLWDPEKQTWHDKAAGSLPVKL